MSNRDRVITIETESRPAESAPRHSPLRCIWHALSLIGATLTFIRNFIANAVMLLVILGIFLAYQAATHFKEEAEILIAGGTPPRTQSEMAALKASPVLYLDLSGTLSEMPLPQSGMGLIERRLSENLDGYVSHELNAVLKALRQAREDENIKCVYVSLSELAPASMAVASRLAEELSALRKAGKEVVTFALAYSQSSYLISAGASRIVLDPMGFVDLKGLALESLYFRDALERFSLTPYIFRAGEFKSAVEPFLLNAMSPAVKAEYQSLADSLWHTYETKLGNYRKALSRSVLLPDNETYLSSLRLYGGDRALMQSEMGLVDELSSEADLLNALASKYGASKDSDFFPDSIAYTDYLTLHPAGSTPERKVAVLYGLGEITARAYRPESFATDNLLPLMDDILNDGSYEAVLLYVNSPGGMVVPSELLRRKVEDLREAGLRVVVTVNGTCASGAYMLASAADKIVATEDSLVGSIGVFGLSLGAHRLLNHYGVYQDGVATHDLARTPLASPLPGVQSESLNLSVRHTYEKFLDDVTKGRNLKESDFKDFAEGRVFTAPDGQRLNLIDSIGSYDDAVGEVAQLLNCNVSELNLTPLSPDQGEGINLFRELFSATLQSLLPEATLQTLGLVREKEELLNGDVTFMALSPVASPRL